MGKPLNWRALPMPCLICGVDSGPIKLFLGFFIGSLVIASVSVLIWALLKGKHGDEKAASMPIEADKRE